jgi:aminoglycoside/choline kinase family phosphotransferase
MITSDKRATAILNWLKNEILLDVHSFQLASSDASFRRYFRVEHPQGSYIVMDAPPNKENTASFIHVASVLTKAKVNVPKIYYKNLSAGFLVLDDFGAKSLLDELSLANANSLYQLALDQLFTLQSNVNVINTDLPNYDSALLTQELSLFYDWFLQKLVVKKLPSSLQSELNKILINAALEQPQVCVHRDYHSRNLMLINANTVGVIDFQDAVMGAITYDLVSLLRDCYIAWPAEKIETWLNTYYQRLFKHKMLEVSFTRFKRWFDLMGLQRQMKAIGIFSRLHLRDHKSSYLADIPRTMAYIEQVCQHYPELTNFHQWLSTEVQPIYQQKL